MFGYVTINQQELKFREYDVYRSYYCGLCHTLEKRYGRRGQLLLNYDMTFLSVLLTGLYEPEEATRKSRCVMHPLTSHAQVLSEVQDYAADMTVLLSYEKSEDDWKDDRSIPAKMLAAVLKRDVQRIRRQWPRQAETLHKCVIQLAQLEKEGCADPDQTAGLTGKFLGEIFVWKEDEWQNDLRRTGFFLGKFIYLMDAWDDLEEDQKKGSYNIFLRMREEGIPCEDPVGMMTDMMAGCAAGFERLPILKNVELLRNIIYSGVWMRCAARQKEREKRAAEQARKTGKNNNISE